MKFFKKKSEEFISQLVNETKKEVKSGLVPVITATLVIFTGWLLIPEKSPDEKTEKQIVNNIHIYNMKEEK